MVKVSFNNFKAFGKHPQIFSAKPITLVYGPNSSGKSSLLHAMLYREYIFNGGHIDLKKSNFAGDELDLGGFKNFVHKHNVDSKIEFTYDIASKKTIQYFLYSNFFADFNISHQEDHSDKIVFESFFPEQHRPLPFWFIKQEGELEKFIQECKNRKIDVDINIDQLRSIINNFYGIEQIKIKVSIGIDRILCDYNQNIEIIINSKLYATITPLGFEDLYSVHFKENHPFVAEIKKCINYKTNNKKIDKYNKFGNNWVSAKDVSTHSIYSILNDFKKEKNKDVDLLFLRLAILIFDGFSNARSKKKIQYFSPLRFYPERKDLVFDKFISDLGNSNVNSSRGIWQRIMMDENARERLNGWLSDDKKLKSTYKIEVEKFYKIKDIKDVPDMQDPDIQELKFLDLRTGVFVTPRDMGLGISQSLPILASCISLEKSKIYIEQPELHLHPAVQCEIADEFIKSKNNNRNNFFIETHSEHILLRIMRRLRYSSEGKINKGDELYITPEDICLLYVDNNGEDTYIKELELDVDGTLLDPWPNGFFEEGYKERFE